MKNPYTERKTNNTPRANYIKRKLERCGYKNPEVWWETIKRGCEMSGYEGGWFFWSHWEDDDGESEYFEPLGYSIQEALEYIDLIGLKEDAGYES